MSEWGKRIAAELGATPSNRYFVGLRGMEVVMLNPPRVMTREHALELAAWIVTMADPTGERFAAVLARVQGTAVDVEMDPPKETG